MAAQEREHIDLLRRRSARVCVCVHRGSRSHRGFNLSTSSSPSSSDSQGSDDRKIREKEYPPRVYYRVPDAFSRRPAPEEPAVAAASHP